MATPPDFTAGQVLTAAQMNAIGLWEVKTQTTSATPVSSVDVTSCFNADFENYFVTFTATSNGTLAAHTLQLLNGSTPAATSYYWNRIVMNSGSTAVTGEAGNNLTSFGVGEQGGIVSVFTVSMMFMNPFESRITRINTDHATFVAGPLNYNWQSQGLHNQSTSYDGFRYLTAAQTFNSATIRVYGYRE